VRESDERLWWRDGVLYQIYPRSFMDTNGDGVGDLEGIRRQLPHPAWLGVDGLWLSPVFPTPMKDFGYDVSDYCDIDPLFGTLEDMDRLVRDAHDREIRVVLDWVPNHTSDRHAWFLESRSRIDSPRRDWYFWRDGRSDRSPPNNWVSVFGGPGWEWDPATGQYYLHSFLKEQPDLNWRNPELVRAMHGVLRFWLDRGVDGFRIDVVQRLLKDPGLRDNPEIAGRAGYGGLRHVHDENHPDVHASLREIRLLLDSYGDRMAVGEVYLMDPVEVAKYYGNGDELHLAFNFSFLRCAWDAAAFRTEVERFEALLPEGCWPTLVLSNHDVPRHATRYDHPELGEARARVAATLLLTLRGTPFLYYGEEIGLRNTPIPEHRVQDPIARTLHPALGRDPERTPMPWEPGPGSGFTTADPWLPFGADADRRNVRLQHRDRGSLLWLYRELIELRRRIPALHRGTYQTIASPEGVFVYERRWGRSVARVALNFSGEPCEVDLGRGAVMAGIRTDRGKPLPERAGKVGLGPSEAIVLALL
jgi:alpha-glucosidase